MNVQFVSDLHLDALERRNIQDRIVSPAPNADLLILAGDIHSGTRAIDVFRDWPVPVLYLAGNHEFYGHHWEQTRTALRRACIGSRIAYLDNDVATFDNLRFLGCTLWTDFLLPGSTQEECMAAVDLDMTQRLIHTRSGPLRSRHMLADHLRSRAWLSHELAKPFDGRTVVVTHHGPHLQSIHARHAGSRLNAGFVSDLTPLLRQADLWLHGHVHDGVEYHHAGCRVVANPAGYAVSRNAAASEGLRFENAIFDPSLVLALAP